MIDSNQDVRNAGLANAKPAVSLIVSRQPNANIIETVDRVKAMLPVFRASIPAAINLEVLLDRTPSIRASLRDTKTTLLLSVGLVIGVVFLFLGSARAALIPRRRGAGVADRKPSARCTSSATRSTSSR